MTSVKIAKRHFEASLADAKASGVDPDILCRAMLGLLIQNNLERRSVADVQSELRFVADNCDPDTDHIFMRP